MRHRDPANELVSQAAHALGISNKDFVADGLVPDSTPDDGLEIEDKAVVPPQRGDRGSGVSTSQQDLQGLAQWG